MESGVARIGPDRRRASARGARDGMGAPAPAVAGAAKAHRRAGASLAEAATRAGEHRHAFVQAALGETYAAPAVLLDRGLVDQLSRCIDGGVAVPACELEALPPPPEDMEEPAGFRLA